MSIQDRIAALPEWPKWNAATVKMSFPNDFAEWDTTCHALVAYGAALARLALAREWIASTSHTEHCATGCDYCRQKDVERDALLAALEPPCS